MGGTHGGMSKFGSSNCLFACAFFFMCKLMVHCAGAEGHDDEGVFL